MPLLNCYQCQFHYLSQILVNNRQKASADGDCFCVHVMSICRLLLLALLSAYQHHTKLADRSQLIVRVANHPGKYRTVSNPTQCGVD